ncbi:MAG: TonB-dependent receptor plug domain-containing protein [Verrucomicrobia bacterium]|nr:TonB-dependent receptor plug domain-containing protein [Verrucomicrobiota bacterium]
MKAAALLFGVALAATAFAQTAPATSAPSTTPKRDEDEAVKLTAFTVKEDQDIGYESMQTTSGMRTAQELKNVANSISIMNAQFIEDLGLLTMEDMAQWFVSGDSNPDPNALVQSRVIMRGFPNAYALRNGWIWYSPMDSFSTERIEELRGPNAFLYGEADVGGANNQITKRGLFTRDLTRVRLLAGSYDLRRAELDLNRRLVKDKLAVRFATVGSYNESWIDNVRRDFKGFYGALTYRPTRQTTVSVMAEHDRTKAILSQGMFVDAFSRTATATLGAIGYIHNTATGTGYRAQGRVTSTGPAIAIIDTTLVPKATQMNGPDSTYKNNTTSVTIEAEHHIGKNLHLQVTGNFYQQALDSWSVNSRNINRDRSPLLPNGQPNPYFNELYAEYFRTHQLNGNIVRDIRFSAVYDFTYFKWMKQQFIANVQQHQDNPGQKKPKFAEYLDLANPNWTGTINPALTQAAFTANRTVFTNNRFYRRYYLRDGLNSDRTDDPSAIPGVSAYLPDLSNAIAATGQFIDRRFYTPSWGVGASGEYFKGHLFTMVGYRQDKFNMKTDRGMVRAEKGWTVDYLESLNPYASRFVRYKVDGANYGAILRFNDMFAVGYNWAQSFRMSVGQGAATFNAGELSSLPVGEGRDISARLSLLQGKLEINYVNYNNYTPNARFPVPGVTTAFRDEMNAIFGSGFDSTATGDYQTTRTKGNEVQVIANPVRNLRLSASYSDNKVSNVDRVPILKELQAKAKAQNRPTPLLDDLIATVPEGVPNAGYTKARGNFFARYQFSEGALKGLAFGGGGNWRLRTYRGAVNLTGAAGAASTNLFSPAYTIYTGYLSYNRKVYNRNTTFQLNVDNLLDKEYYRSAAIGSGSWGDPRTFRFTVSTDL